jgi:predicted nucleic acid-binding Zn ribbon protein
MVFSVEFILPSKPGQSHELTTAHELISRELSRMKNKNVIFFVVLKLISVLKIGYLLIDLVNLHLFYTKFILWA